MNLIDRRRKRTSVWLSAAFAGVCILGTGQVEAAKMPKVEICHFDADEGVFKKISVSGNAVQNHLANHGDIFPASSNGAGTITLDAECNEVIARNVFSRAYIDTDRNGTYDSQVDVEISELVDTNMDGVINAGDTVEFGQYPKTFDPCSLPPDADCPDLGNLNPTPVVVTHVFSATPTSVIVQSASGSLFNWETPGGLEIVRLGIIPEQILFDSFLNQPNDAIKIPIGGDADPSDAVDMMRPGNGANDYFFNVEINLAP